MIPTRTSPRSTLPGNWRPARLLMAALAGLLLLAACTNSKLLVAPLYNRLDDQIRKEFNKLGDWNEEQTAMFEARVGTAHVWHRQSELPAYADLLDDIADSIGTAERTTQADIDRWASEVEARTVDIRRCHPVNFSFALMKTATDEQIDFIERRFARERKKNRARYLERTAEGRVTHRLGRIDKWTRRVGVEMNAAQRAMLRTALTNQISLRDEYYVLSEQWNKELFRLARDQSASDYDTKMKSHFDSLWTLLEDAHPDAWQRNRDMWREVAHRFVGSLTDEQRAEADAWLSKMADTLGEVARDEPSFTVSNDPSLGCLVVAQNE